MIPKKILEAWLPTKELRAIARETKVLDQIERALGPDVWFDAGVADDAVAFFPEFLVHIEGRSAGEKFVLDPWEELLVRTIWGFWTSDDEGKPMRLILHVYVEIPRKNGKSSFGAGLVLKLLFADGELGAQVYGAAYKRDQAAIIFRVVEQMVLKSPRLLERAQVNSAVKRILVIDPETGQPTGSFYAALPGEVKGQTGYNASGVVVDELHEQVDRDLLNVLETSTGSRQSPLELMFTTAGEDGEKDTPCRQEHLRALQILEGTLTDRRGLVLVFAADAQKDDWKKPAVWARVNPGVKTGAKRMAIMQADFDKALGNPELENNFKRFHLNMWIGSRKGWLSVEKWDQGGGLIDETELQGRDCFLGVDLATVDDVAAVAYVFAEPAPKPWTVLWDCFIPADNVAERVKKTRIEFDRWIEQGWLTATPGNVIDYDAIETRIQKRLADWKARCVELGFDPFQAQHFSQDMQAEGYTTVDMPNTGRYMNLGVKTVEELVLGGRILHGGNPILRWMFGNTVIATNSAGERKPDKAKSAEKIDGITALVMAASRAALHIEQAAPDIITIGGAA